VIPQIHQTIERVRHVRSFTAQSGGGGNGSGSGKSGRAAGSKSHSEGEASRPNEEELVTLDYFLGDAVEPRIGHRPDQLSSQSELEALQASLSAVPGVVRVLSDVLPSQDMSPTLLAASPLASAPPWGGSAPHEWPSFILPPATHQSSPSPTPRDARGASNGQPIPLPPAHDPAGAPRVLEPSHASRSSSSAFSSASSESAPGLTRLGVQLADASSSHQPRVPASPRPADGGTPLPKISYRCRSVDCSSSFDGYNAIAAAVALEAEQAAAAAEREMRHGPVTAPATPVVKQASAPWRERDGKVGSPGRQNQGAAEARSAGVRRSASFHR
jgi:hypothetical protein